MLRQAHLLVTHFVCHLWIAYSGFILSFSLKNRSLLQQKTTMMRAVTGNQNSKAGGRKNRNNYMKEEVAELGDHYL